jgi:RNA polymerase sigma factor (sigma-70 family)
VGSSSGAAIAGGEVDISRNFDDFYRAEVTGLVVLATGVLGRRSGADDLVQEAMLEAYRRWDRLSTYESPRAWVRRVVVQRAVKAAKKADNERAAHLRALPRRPHEDVVVELDPELRTQLQALPAQQRAVLALHYLEDSPVSEIAEVLGIAEGTVKVHLSRGRTRLAEALAPSEEQEGS